MPLTKAERKEIDDMKLSIDNLEEKHQRTELNMEKFSAQQKNNYASLQRIENTTLKRIEEKQNKAMWVFVTFSLTLIGALLLIGVKVALLLADKTA